MTEKRQVVIFDDEQSLRAEWRERLRNLPGFPGQLEVQVVESEDFKDDLHILHDRRRALRENQERPCSDTLFDQTSILIVDYDLFKLGKTGEEVAYLARCFSECGVIVAVNQYASKNTSFDLTLKGHPESFADLNLLSEQIFNPGLWSIPWEGFRPWHWPLLPECIDSFEQRVLDLLDNTDQKILDFLQIPNEVREIFPMGALEFISSADATFRIFVEESGQGLRSKDHVSDRAIARIAAARLSKWLERMVLPGQNILVDAAHLIERYPSLFTGNTPERLIGWPSTHELLAPDATAIDLAKLEPFRFVRKGWLSRVAWYWPLLSEFEQISEVADPWVPRTELAFCEDTSRFAHPMDVKEFIATVDSPFIRRFVSSRDPGYGPKQQFVR